MLERAFIHAIADKTSRKHPNLIAGIGDDCAVFRTSSLKDQLISTDMLLEDIHFDLRWHAPYLLGRKALSVNISDIAAMGGNPQFVLLSVGMVSYLDTEWFDLFVEGLNSALIDYDCVLIGGDTVSSEKLTLSVTVIGDSPQGCCLQRNGAREGDLIFVSGFLGSAAAGLYLCQNSDYNRQTITQSNYPELITEHLDPTAQVELGRLLRESGCLTSMQDISDGIATDLSHICSSSGVAAEVHEEALPCHPELAAMAEEYGINPTTFQLKGGEDYQLVFTVKRNKESVLQEISAKTMIQFTRIGEIVAGTGLTCVLRSGERVDIGYQGYEHIG